MAAARTKVERGRHPRVSLKSRGYQEDGSGLLTFLSCLVAKLPSYRYDGYPAQG